MANPFKFSKQSRKAILIFVIIFLLIVLFPRIYFVTFPTGKYTFHQSKLEAERGEDFVKNKYSFSKKKFSYAKKVRFTSPTSKFDPNQYSKEDWMKLGLSEKQAIVVLKMGKYGFYKREDIQRIFVINEELFGLIKDSLIFPEKTQKSKFFSKDFEYKVAKNETEINFLIELNSATVEELIKIKGIGEYFAKNILKRRDELGGFYHEMQLIEVWKMDEEKIQSIAPQIKIDKTNIKKLNINTVSAQELKNHPYFSWNVANSIVKLRSQIGGFKSIDEIKQSVLIDELLFEKIKHYITI